MIKASKEAFLLFDEVKKSCALKRKDFNIKTLRVCV